MRSIALRAWVAPQAALLWLVAALMIVSTPAFVKSFTGLPTAHISLDWTWPGAPAADAANAVLPAPPAFVFKASDFDRAEAVHCLAQAIYYEAGFEPLAGQRAVAQVVLNRVRDRNFPSTICGVVYQGQSRKTGCQFSFVCDGSLDRRPPHVAQWVQAEIVAAQALDGVGAPEVGTATHYHTDYVDPWWKPTLVEVARIGTHVFYRWPGKAGQPGALDNGRYAGEIARIAQSVAGGRA